jgi:hypothetical protein
MLTSARELMRPTFFDGEERHCLIADCENGNDYFCLQALFVDSPLCSGPCAAGDVAQAAGRSYFCR